MFQVVKRDGEIAEFQMAKIHQLLIKHLMQKKKTTVKI